MRRFLTVLAICAVALGALTVPTAAKSRPTASGITSVDVLSDVGVGTYGGLAYRRVVGVVHGKVAAGEKVVGLDLQPQTDGAVSYSAPFEIIRPTGPAWRRSGVVVVEAENRGNPLMIQLFNDFVGGAGPPATTTYPEGYGNAFLFKGGRAYARVSWQTGISPNVPANAQGIGEVIVRDFGRLLRDGGPGERTLGTYRHPILTGWSQGAWFVNTFVAEGFNADPRRAGTGVYDGAIALSGAGNWLAINQLGDDGLPQDPYLRPDGRPLTASQILTRPRSDPFFVDIANLTDFYRLRAGLTATPSRRHDQRRYEWPSAHGPSFFVTNQQVFTQLACNGGVIVPLNPLDFRPYLRATLVGLEAEIHAPTTASQQSTVRGLPASSHFRLTDPPPASPFFAPLPGVVTPVPASTPAGIPVGGVGFPEQKLPLGAPVPVSLPPVSTASINALCGNIGGWTPRAASDLAATWPTPEAYVAGYAKQLDRLIRDGYLLPLDRQGMLDAARASYLDAVEP
jgi:hypothetical protein